MRGISRAQAENTRAAMSDPMKPEFTAQNPIVEAAERIRARRQLGAAIDAGTSEAPPFDDAESGLRAFAQSIMAGCTRINAILGERHGVKLIRLEKPLRLRVRFGEKRVSLDLDDVNQLVRVSGLGLDGDYQFVPAATTPALINISIVSTEAGYGEPLTASSLLKTIAQDAELPRPSHLQGDGPLKF
jgi:hypothetical protein